MAVEDQIVQLRLSVERFKPEQQVDWQIGVMANTLIEQAKQQAQGNAVVDAIPPFAPGPNDRYIGNANAGTVVAVLQQLEAALHRGGGGSAVASWSE